MNSHCAWIKLTDHPDENVATHRFRAPTKIIITQQAPHNTFSFFIQADGRHTGKLLSTAIYLNYFYLFFLIGLGWLYRGVDNITTKIRGVR